MISLQQFNCTWITFPLILAIQTRSSGLSLRSMLFSGLVKIYNIAEPSPYTEAISVRCLPKYAALLIP